MVVLKKAIHPKKNVPDHGIIIKFLEAVPYDVPIIGYKNNTVNMLRLWKSQASEGFQLDVFNQGDYVKAVEEKIGLKMLQKYCIHLILLMQEKN